MEKGSKLPLHRLFRSKGDDVVAGIDVGSNSFHMLVARAEEDGRVHVLDRLRDPVRLAAGLDENHELTTEAEQLALASLARFGERLHGLPPSAVRAVGTNTLRRARNGSEMAHRASEALGHPIEIISGREEARLIYLGVAQGTAEDVGRHLVLDIGGGSTECIIGKGLEPLAVDSLYMGCVGYTQRFFGNGRISRERFRKAEIAASLEFSGMKARYRDVGWDRASGSSGTILAVQEVLRANGWSRDCITAEALGRLEDELVAGKRIEALSLPGVEPDRAAVFPGGVAILKAAFAQLSIDTLGTSSGALREGLVFELLGGVLRGDPRDRTVDTLVGRYKVDREQARRVEETALDLFEQANDSWDEDAETGGRFLGWAARLHEIGLSIAYSGHHKHGAYILEHGEMPGFSLDEQAVLAAVVGAHRRKLSRRQFAHLVGESRRFAQRLTVLLRLAVRLHHSRSDHALPRIRLRARKSRILLEFPPGWLQQRPLTRADLDEEVGALGRIGFTLELEDAA